MKHLSTNVIKQLAGYELAGEKLLNALRHVEGCDACRDKMPAPSNRDVLKRLEPEAAEYIQGVNPRFQTNWKLGFAMVTFAAFFFVLVGIAYWQVFLDKSIPEVAIVANSPDSKTPTISNSENATEKKQDDSKELTKRSDSGTANVAEKEDRRSILAVKKRATSTKRNLKKRVRSSKNFRIPIPSSIRKSLSSFLAKTPQVLADLSPNVTTVRGPNGKSNNHTLSTPIGEVIKGTSPVFKWDVVERASKYRLYLMDRNFNEVVTKVVSVTKHKFDKSLERGKLYQWKVVAETPDGEVSIPGLPNPPAIFRVASAGTVEKLKAFEKKAGSEWKILNLLLTKGLLTEAAKKIKRILKKDPKNRLARKLNSKIQRLTRKKNQRKSPTETKPAQ